jgi:hypothetical protein
MKSKFLDTQEFYDGTQLRSLFAYLGHGLLGDSIVAWIGPCNVSLDHMVDGEDLREQAQIRGERMVHFIVEMFDCSLLAAVNAQRLLASIVMENLRTLSGNKKLAHQLHRDGDDIFAGKQKLSISIATVSPTSALIHFAVNVVNEGTPVATLCLQDLQVDAKGFAETILKAFENEMVSVKQATKKVKWVR